MDMISSKPGTPVKKIRSKEEGGLTPLPHQDGLEPMITLPSTTTNPVNTETSHIQFKPSKEDLKLVSDEYEEDFSPNTNSIHEFVSSILQRQNEIMAKRDENEQRLDLLKKVVETNNSTVIRHHFAREQKAASGEKQSAKDKAQEKLNEKIYQGLMKIRELDVVLRDKLHTADRMKKDRLARESEANTPVAVTPSDNMSEISDDDDFELKSFHSEDVKAFITEPQLELRAKVGRQALDMASKTKLNVPVKKDDKKGYTPGNFIERNIVLGTNARYYSALSEEEQERVNKILEMEDLYGEEPADGKTSRASTADESIFSDDEVKENIILGFLPPERERSKLEELDTKLSKLIPPTDWERKSIVWTPSTSTPMSASGTVTPNLMSTRSSLVSRSYLSSARTSSTNRDLETVMSDVTIATSTKLVEDVKERLQQIDEELDKMKQTELRPATREDIEQLLTDYMAQMREPEFSENSISTQ